MNNRDEILKQINKYKYHYKKNDISLMQDKSIFRNYPENDDDLIPTFINQLENLSGEGYFIENKEIFREIFTEVLKDINPDFCRTHKSPLLNKIKKTHTELAKYFQHIDEENIDNISFSKFEVGITTADALIARTGSVLLTSASAAGRRLSVLPPTHVVIAEKSQVVRSLEDAFRILKSVSYNWSYATVISGPSRTSDIEKQLVLGAHGPKRLIVFILNEQ